MKTTTWQTLLTDGSIADWLYWSVPESNNDWNGKRLRLTTEEMIEKFASDVEPIEWDGAAIFRNGVRLAFTI